MIVAVLGYIVGNSDSREMLVIAWEGATISGLGIGFIVIFFVGGLMAGTILHGTIHNPRYRLVGVTAVFLAVLVAGGMTTRREISKSQDYESEKRAAIEVVRGSVEVAEAVGGIRDVSISMEHRARSNELPNRYTLSVMGSRRNLLSAVVDIDRSSGVAKAIYRCVFDKNSSSLDARIRDYCDESANAKSDELKAILRGLQK
jgi:hypothetical protein